MKYQIGTGSGVLNIAQGTYQPGDVLAIKPGIYTGGSFTGLKGLTIINDNGVVTFSGSVSYGNNTNVAVIGNGSTDKYGIKFSALVKKDCFSIVACNNGCTFRRIEVTGSGAMINCSGVNIIYQQSISTTILNNTVIDDNYLHETSQMLVGSFGVPSQLINVINTIVVSNNVFANTTTDGSQVRGAGIYKMLAFGNTITGPTPNGAGDVGVFYIQGNGVFFGNRRDGGYGWLNRIYLASLDNVVTDTYIYNNIDENTTCYGSFEVRNDPATFSNGIVGSNLHIFNNSAGNKKDAFGTYTAAIVLIPSHMAGYKYEIKNNLSWNCEDHQGAINGVVVWSNPAGNMGPIDATNNLYAATATGLVDPVTCRPLTGSPAIGKGATIPFVQNDYYGTPRTIPYDIGAVAAVAIPVNVNAGPDQAITLPVNSAVLQGSASIAVGTISSYLWTQTAGPSQPPISGSATPTATVNNLQQGSYTFKLTATASNGSIGFATCNLVVSAAPNKPPVANAGQAQTITLPANTVTLDGSLSSDPDGTITSYQWVLASGPAGAIIGTPQLAKTNATIVASGTYVFQLTVTDDRGATAQATVAITVNPAPNQPPTARAQIGNTFGLPVLDASLSSDSDGTIKSYMWDQISGSPVVITNPTSAKTTFSGFGAGTFIFRITVTDNGGATSTATVQFNFQ